jgi:hypothetical protein
MRWQSLGEDLEGTVGPLLEDRYYRFEYMRMWWPSWNYYNLNADRMAGASGPLNFSPDNVQGAAIRRGLFDIWWSRDYTRYGEAVGDDYSLDTWDPGERLLFYVRKDIASQVWNLGLGEGTAANPLTQTTANLCTDNWQQRYADYALVDAAAAHEPQPSGRRGGRMTGPSLLRKSSRTGGRVRSNGSMQVHSTGGWYIQPSAGCQWYKWKLRHRV